MANSHGLTDEELALLTDEEREGLENDDEDIDEEEHDDDTDTGGDDDDDTDDDDADAGKDNGAQGAEQQPAKVDDQPAGQEKQEEDEQPQGKAAQPVPLFKSEVPADIEDRFKDIDKREESLIEKFEDGDLTTREYNAELRKLNKERSDLEWTQRKAELSQETSQSQREQQWYNEINAFLPAHPLISKNETTWNSFDAVLRKVTAATIEAGNFPGRADIEKAYKQWAEDLGIEVSAEPAPKKATEQQPAQQATDKKSKSQVVPPTLGKIPAAAGTETDDGKYAHLDRLAESDPVAYEEALAKLSPAEWEEYSQSN